MSYAHITDDPDESRPQKIIRATDDRTAADAHPHRVWQAEQLLLEAGFVRCNVTGDWHPAERDA